MEKVIWIQVLAETSNAGNYKGIERSYYIKLHMLTIQVLFGLGKVKQTIDGYTHF
jgi:hypothetical protein